MGVVQPLSPPLAAPPGLTRGRRLDARAGGGPGSGGPPRRRYSDFSGTSNQTALPSGVGREPQRVANWSTR
ncbi:hypothetical protein GCM10023224_22610 [Streptomonospora halophila]|uniref:Uncharacterized protein n=1 Tax=Streptomonospora halophila TaxID=427369 RepID=A0ABP9GHW2_9ACTN